MKKLIVAIHIIAAVGLAGAADLVVPKTDERTILRQPLNEGRLAYRDLGNGTATLAVGQAGSAHPLTIVDPLSLRGWKRSVLQKSEYAIGWTSGFTYDGVNDKYTLGATTGVWERIVITALGNRKISKVDYTEENLTPGILGKKSCAKTNKIVTDNQVILEAMKINAGTYYVKDIVVYGLVEGSSTEKIDLTDLHVNVIDEIGASELGKWRTWARDLYNGNRGSDWSHYKAKENVFMLGNRAVFGPTNESISAVSIGQSIDDDRSIDINANGNIAMRIGPPPSSEVIPAGAIISNLTIGVTNTSVYITIKAFNFPGFDIGKVKLFWSPTADPSRENHNAIPFTQTGSNPYLLVSTKIGDGGYYLVKYGNANAYVEVKCPMKVHELRIIGTDDKIYRIDINAGIMTATEITE